VTLLLLVYVSGEIVAWKSLLALLEVLGRTFVGASLVFLCFVTVNIKGVYKVVPSCFGLWVISIFLIVGSLGLRGIS